MAELPSANAIRSIISARQLRADFFPADLFADPAWDILLDLALARAERRAVNIIGSSTSSGVPNTTTLRYIGRLVDAGLVIRRKDDADRRHAFLELSDHGLASLAAWFSRAGVV